MATPTRWQRLERLFERACALPVHARADFLKDACGGDADLQAELEALLRADAAVAGFFAPSPHHDDEASGQRRSLPDGAQLGAWRVLRLLGHGGMGEVYEGERTGSGFRQRAALKLLRHDAAGQDARFRAERNILARLEHPGIARLLDGGVGADGRPWAAIEYVEGRPITAFCDEAGADARARLRLFLQVCDAVAHAHRNLVVHRDLKPSNILVDAAGRVRLLDFGIAKLLGPADWSGGEATAPNQLPLTPDYCAPEQLAGEPVTTATDVYALGLLLFGLLARARPWPVHGQPLARALRMLLDTPAPGMSATAAADAPIAAAARGLRDDLDAIVARCLRREPAHRYPSVDALRRDVACALDGAPVAAREGTRLYLLGRFLARHRLPAAAAALVLLALTAGLVGIAWQAGRAQEQAERALAIKEYLVRVFKASDPRIASDRPRGAITARELLDIGADRIDREFAGRPDLQIEMLGLTAEIYRELGETERYLDLHRRQMALATRVHGPLHPAVIGGLLRESEDARLRGDHPAALALVERTDGMIRRAGLDGTPLRARWWLQRANALEADPESWDERMQALTEAARLYERTADDDWSYVVTLANIAAAYWDRGQRGDEQASRDWSLRAVAAAGTSRERSDGEMQVIHANLGYAEAFLGNAAAADAAFAHAVALARSTYGEDNYRYWYAAVSRAMLLHETGERERALRIFGEVAARLPAQATAEAQGAALLARTLHGTALVREGRPREALPLLEAAKAARLGSGGDSYHLHYLRQGLGEAYEALGRDAEARRQFGLSLRGRADEGAADSLAVLTGRERWARFLLAQGELEAAAAQFDEVVAVGGGAPRAPAALALGGLARIALEQARFEDALELSGEAIAMLERIEGLHDVRGGPYLWLIRARALALHGERAEAETWARKALHAYRRYQHPQAPEIAAAEALLAELEADPR